MSGGFMMIRKFGFGAIAFLAGLLAMPCHAGEVGDYLTKDGKLKETIRIQEGGVDFLAPPGDEWVIEPSGEWANKHAETRGKLSARQLAALAQHFATQDFQSLPEMQGFQPNDRPYHYVVISFGKKDAGFYTKIGESPADYLPKPGDPKAAVWSRFIALELVLADMLHRAEIQAKGRK
jgi:hypothetical protein